MRVTAALVSLRYTKQTTVRACVRECVRVCVFASSEEGTGSKNNMYKNYNLIFNFHIKFSFGRVLGRGGGVKGNTELN